LLFAGASFGLLVAAAVPAQQSTGANPALPDKLVVGDFSGAPPGSLPEDWKALIFRDIKSHTRYSLVADPQYGQVVRAEAAASASGLVHKVSLDPHEWPILQWRWKIDRLVAKADPTRKDGDDYPARIYVSFAYDPARVAWYERPLYAAAKLFYGEYPPQSGLNYIFDNKSPVGTIVPNAFTGRVRMIVVDSGEAHVGQWQSYQRNIVEDYRKAFGEDAPAISGVAIMTDTDNTGESATAWYANITLHRAAP